MTTEEVIAAFREDSDEFLKFDRVPEERKPSKRPDLLSLAALTPAMERDIHLAIAETNLALCREEAKVTGANPEALCERRRRELDESRAPRRGTPDKETP